MRGAWTTTIVPSQPAGGYNAPGSSMSNPVALQTERSLYEGPLRKQVEQAQEVFDEALAMILAGEQPKLITEGVWRRVAAQASEPARKAKVRAYSAKRREAAAEQKRLRAEKREAAKVEENGNGSLPADVTEEDLHDAAVEEELALALADGHLTHDDPAGETEREA